MSLKATTPTATTNQPPWMVELKKTQAEKKNEVKLKKNFSLGDESNSSALNQSTGLTSSFNGTSPNSSKKSIIAPSSPTKLTPNRMSGDYSQRFKDFLQNSPNTNSLSRHSSVHTSNNFNSSRTLSTDSLDCKEQPSSQLGFGQLASPFASVVKPIKAAKPTTTKFMSSSPTTHNSLLSSNLTTQTPTTASINQSKDAVSRKEFEDLQKKASSIHR